jgi:hypothetical protein
MEQLASVSVSGFSASASFADGTLLVVLKGNGDLAAQPALASFVPQVHGEALARRASLVTVDLRGMEFMNSSCIKELVSWLQLLVDAEPDRRYRIRFLQGAQHWQNRSLQVLRAFAADLVDIER